MKENKNTIEASRTLPVEVKFEEDSIHDIDLFANGPMEYDFVGQVPTNFNGETLAQMFPRGFNMKSIDGYGNYGFGNKQWVKQWYFVWESYNQITQAISQQWEYDGLPEEIKWYNLEKLLQRNGQLAFVKYQGKYLALTFSTEKKDIYDEPIEIKAQVDNSEIKDKIFKKGEFVIIKDNPEATPLFNIVSPYIQQLFSIKQAQYTNLYASQPKGILLTNFIDENGKVNTLAKSLNDISGGRKTFYSLVLGQDTQSSLDYQKELLSGGSQGLFIPITLPDLSESLIKQFEHTFNQLKERVGLSQDLSFDKKERLVSQEVGARNNVSELTKMMKFAMRQDAINDINKEFGLDIKIELVENENDEVQVEQTGENDYAIE